MSRPMTEQHKRKIGDANKISHKGLLWKEQSRKKMSRTLKTQYAEGTRAGYWKGKKLSSEHAKKISEGNKGKIGFDAVAITDIRIKKEIAELEAQGFKCVPVGGKVRPDIIAVKDGKIYAVEIEYKTPNYSKYTDEAKAYFEEVIWILRKKS